VCVILLFIYLKKGLLVCGLEKLTRLENLELYDNQLTEPPKQLVMGSSKLLSLRMERNRLDNLRNLGKCKALTSLIVDGNRLHSLVEGDGSSWLFACQNLSHFSCSDNDIDKLPVKCFSGCPNLTELALSRNCLNDNSLKALAPLDQLQRLRLDGNHLV
jgi:Leucine-rich repeat (LRR) protein